MTTYIAQLDGNDRSPTYGQIREMYRIREEQGQITPEQWEPVFACWMDRSSLLTSWTRLSLPNRMEVSEDRVAQFINR